MGEFGPKESEFGGYNFVQLLDRIKQSYPQLTYFLAWHDWTDHYVSLAATARDGARTLFQDECVTTLRDWNGGIPEAYYSLPAGGTVEGWSILKPAKTTFMFQEALTLTATGEARWFSERQGYLGQGTSLTVDDLNVGTHVISALPVSGAVTLVDDSARVVSAVANHPSIFSFFIFPFL